MRLSCVLTSVFITLLPRLAAAQGGDTSVIRRGFAVPISTSGAVLGNGEIVFSTQPSGGFGSTDKNLVWDSLNLRLGVGNAIPATPLDVSGTSQFGTGVTKSTITSTGAITMDPAAALTPGTRTKLQFDTLVPAVGQVFVCSNCSATYDLCVGTGTAAAQWRVSGGTKGCGSGN